MSLETKFETHKREIPSNNNAGKVKLTDLLIRMNEEKRKEKKTNLALSVAAISAVTVFGIILSQ